MRFRARVVALAAAAIAIAAAHGASLPPPPDDPGPVLRVAGRELLFGSRTVRLFGQGDPLLLVKSRADELAEVAWYEPFRSNFTRIAAFDPFIPDSEEPLQPFLEVNSTQVDLSVPNAAYYDRLRGYIRENWRTGRVVLLQVFDEVGLERGADRWDLNPFRPGRNVNGLRLPGSGRDAVPEFYDLENGALLSIQERYVRELVARTHVFGNVIYEICNEYTGSAEWLSHMIGLFRELEAELGKNLLLTNMSCNGFLLGLEAGHPGIDVLDLFHAPESLRDYSPRQIYDRFVAARSFGKPLISGRIGPEPDNSDLPYLGLRRARYSFWALFMAGAVGATTKEDDNGPRSRFGPPIYPDDPEWELLIHALQQFASDAGDLRGYGPAPEMIRSAPASTAFALASPRRVLVYLAEPTGGTLRLSGLGSGPYTVKYFDPFTGGYLGVARTVTSGGEATIPTPTFFEDLAVVLDSAPLSVTLLRPLLPRPEDASIRVHVVRHDGIDADLDGRVDYTSRLVVDGRDLPLDRQIAVDALRQRRVEITRLTLDRLPRGWHEIAVRVEDVSGGARDTAIQRFFVR